MNSVELFLRPGNRPLHLNYQPLLCGAVNSALRQVGYADLHDETSLFSYSWLNGRIQRQGDLVTFPDGAYWRLKSHDALLLEALVFELETRRDLFSGMRANARETRWLREKGIPSLDQYFEPGSPILVRQPRTEDGPRRDYVPGEDGANETLSQLLMMKAEKAGIEGTIEIMFQPDVEPHGRRRVTFRKGEHLIHNTCFFHPVRLIASTPAMMDFARRVGVGHSTGAGFGYLN